MAEPRIGALAGEALVALAQNKLRTALTLLGVVIGVASVILMVAIGQTANSAITRSLEAMGTNLIIVFSGSATTAGVRGASGSLPTLTQADARELGSLPEVRAVSAVVARPQQVSGNGKNINTTVVGVEEAYFAMTNSPVDVGEPFSATDVHSATRLVVLGATAKQALFGSEPAVGEEVRINRVPYTVVGLLKAKGSNFTGQDEDDIVLMPLSSAQRNLFASLVPGSVQAILVEAQSRSAIPLAQKATVEILRARHRLAEDAADDFSAKSTLALAETTQTAAKLLSVLLGSIASISLLVGGIGIMNVMLVGVAERTREIGIRMAVGAKERHIVWQFLVEALLLALGGGLIGVAIALGVVGLTRMAGVFPLEVSWQAVTLALGVALATGVLFGLYPARRAARLDPVVALRHD